MTISDKTKRIGISAIVIILLLSVILPLVFERFESSKAESNVVQINALYWTWEIIRFLTAPVIILWLALVFYSDWMLVKIERIEQAARMKVIIYAVWLLNLAILVLLASKFLIVLYVGSGRLALTTIKFALFSFCFGYYLVYYWQQLRYFRTHALQTVVAACLREQSNKFLNAQDFDKAYSLLVKACDVAPDETLLWCNLAYFCELIRKDKIESDKYMTKAKELIASKKADSKSDKACYLNYLGTILYQRGDYNKGLEYIKQSIDIEPIPWRISSYEKKLSEINRPKSHNGL